MNVFSVLQPTEVFASVAGGNYFYPSTTNPLLNLYLNIEQQIISALLLTIILGALLFIAILFSLFYVQRLSLRILHIKSNVEKRSVEYYFDIIRSQIITFSGNKTVVDAVKPFPSIHFQIAFAQDQTHFIGTSSRAFKYKKAQTAMSGLGFLVFVNSTVNCCVSQ